MRTLSPGTRYARLIVLDDAGEDLNGNRRCLCRCDCGQRVEVYVWNIIYGYTKSCGCLKRERVEELNRKRGHVRSVVFRMDREEYMEKCRHNRSGWCALKDRQCGSFACARMRYYRKVKGE